VLTEFASPQRALVAPVGAVVLTGLRLLGDAILGFSL
jgi:hypothetical protein